MVVKFSGLHDGFILPTSLQRKVNYSNMLCYRLHRNEFYTGILNSWYLFP